MHKQQCVDNNEPSGNGTPLIGTIRGVILEQFNNSDIINTSAYLINKPDCNGTEKTVI